MNRLSFLFIIFFQTSVIAASSYYVVDKIEVKQKDKNSLVAKDKSLSVALRTAFSKLITDELELDSSNLKSVSNSQIQNCVYDYSIEHEKFSDSVYIAEISYRFDKVAIGKLLKICGIETNIAEEQEDVQFITVAVYTNDYLLHINELNKLNCLVDSFSKDIVNFKIHSDFLKSLKKLGIKHVVI